MNIRQFRYTDLESVIHIAKISFAEEYVARGETPEGFAKQVRMVAKGRMLPFKLLTAFSGIRWKLFVAELDGKIVGFGSYLGRTQMELANLMVHPKYRRQGIGQALLEKRLEHLREQGYPFATTTILASNQASLGNVKKQGFEVFDQFTIWEKSLSQEVKTAEYKNELLALPFQSSDKAVFKELEKQIVDPAYLQIQGSALPLYFPSLGGRLMNRFAATQRWIRAFSKDGSTLGFLLAETSIGQNKGTIGRPLVLDKHIDYLAPMLHEATAWLNGLNKTAIQLSVPINRVSIIEKLQNSGWIKTQSWVRLIKKLAS